MPGNWRAGGFYFTAEAQRDAEFFCIGKRTPRDDADAFLRNFCELCSSAVKNGPVQNAIRMPPETLFEL